MKSLELKKISLELKDISSYLKEKRDDELKRLNDLIRSGAIDYRINNCFNSLLRKNNQLKLAEDAHQLYEDVNRISYLLILHKFKRLIKKAK